MSASLVPASEYGAGFDYLTRQASALYVEGNEFGDSPTLMEAIRVY